MVKKKYALAINTEQALNKIAKAKKKKEHD